MSMSTQPLSTAATAAAPSSPAPARLPLWDLPIRVFHWSLVAAVMTAVITGQLGGNLMAVHGQAGLVIVGLVVFRLVWGLVGSTHARFLTFLPTPRKIRAYLRGQWRGVGHNPLGALSVLALLALLAAQATTGLFANDDIAFAGPLVAWVDEALSSRLTGLHHLLADALLILLGLHVLAIAFYGLFKKDNLVKPMVTGYKEMKEVPATDADHRSQPPRRGGGWAAFLIALVAALAAVYVASGAALSHEPPAPAATVQPKTPPASAW